MRFEREVRFLGAVCNVPRLGKPPHNLGYVSAISPSEISEASRIFQNLLLNLLILCRLFFCLVRRDAQDPLIPLCTRGTCASNAEHPPLLHASDTHERLMHLERRACAVCISPSTHRHMRQGQPRFPNLDRVGGWRLDVGFKFSQG